MHAPPWQVSPAAHAPAATHAGQPVAVAAHCSSPLPPHRFVPTEQLTAHAAQVPPTHEVPVPHAAPPDHTVQLFTSLPQVSVPMPLQRAAPTVQVVPQTPHAPPLQKLPHCWPACRNCACRNAT